MKTSNDIWKDVKGREGIFQVSDQGCVRSLPHSVRHWCGRMIQKPGGILKQSNHSGGYSIVALRDGKKHYVHRLVMEAFVGEQAGLDVNHIDGDKSNNCRTNLEYCNRLHNVRHAIATGLQDNGGESNGMNKYSADSIIAAHRMVAGGAKHAEAARATGVSESMVQQVVAGKRWKCLGLRTLTLLLLLTTPLYADRARQMAMAMSLSVVSVEASVLEPVVESRWCASPSAAKRTGKPVAVYLTTNNCPHCITMDRLWQQAPVIEASAEYACLKLGPRAAVQLKVRAFPAVVLLSPRGVVLKRLIGAVSQATLLSALEHATVTTANVYRGYPVRNRGSWWKLCGEYVSADHLIYSANHRGKFDANWVRKLSWDSRQSLHTDDHLGVVQWAYVLRPST